MDYVISDRYLRLVLSDRGAELLSVKKDGREYLWEGDPQYWGERSPLLFPYVGRLTEGKYRLGGSVYEMGIHGFARHRLYEVVCREEEKIIFELRDDAETYRMYPFHFILQVIYELQGEHIAVTYRVANCSQETMYFGIGGHPGFRMPLEEGLRFSDYYLEFSGEGCPERIGHTPACFLSGRDERFPLEDGRILRLSHEMFDDDAIVLRNMADAVTLKSDRSMRQVKVSYPDMPYLGIWHAPRTDAPYICIEPWTSLPSRQGIVEEFKYKSDLIRLAPGGQYVNTWGITIR